MMTTSSVTMMTSNSDIDVAENGHHRGVIAVGNDDIESIYISQSINIVDGDNDLGGMMIKELRVATRTIA